jgi:hypothetical protein
MNVPNPMKLFHREDKGLEFRQTLIHQEQQVDANRPGSAMEDLVEMTRKIGYLTIDENIINFLHNNASMHPLLAPFSPLNSTIILNKQQASLKRIRFENLFSILKLTMEPSTYEANGFEVLEGLRMYAHDRVSEAEEGWKGHLCTENVKRIEAHTEKK